MLTLPTVIIPILTPFATLFQRRTWEKVQVLLMGVNLAPGKRTVTSALRVMGLSHDGSFAKYHQVLNRASWSSLKLSQVLLNLLLRYLASVDGPLVFGIDKTLERLWRTVKYEDIYIKGYATVAELEAGLADYFWFYNHERPHQALGYQTPAEVYFGNIEAESVSVGIRQAALV
jgi:hypothetical protein